MITLNADHVNGCDLSQSLNGTDQQNFSSHECLTPNEAIVLARIGRGSVRNGIGVQEIISGDECDFFRFASGRLGY